MSRYHSTLVTSSHYGPIKIHSFIAPGLTPRESYLVMGNFLSTAKCLFSIESSFPNMCLPCQKIRLYLNIKLFLFRHPVKRGWGLLPVFLQLPVTEKFIFQGVGTENGVPHSKELGRQLMILDLNLRSLW